MRGSKDCLWEDCQYTRRDTFLGAFGHRGLEEREARIVLAILRKRARGRATCVAGTCRDDDRSCGVAGAPEPASVVQMFFSTSTLHHTSPTQCQHSVLSSSTTAASTREMPSRSLTLAPTGRPAAMLKLTARGWNTGRMERDLSRVRIKVKACLLSVPAGLLSDTLACLLLPEVWSLAQ